MITAWQRSPFRWSWHCGWCQVETDEVWRSNGLAREAGWDTHGVRECAGRHVETYERGAVIVDDIGRACDAFDIGVRPVEADARPTGTIWFD